MITATDKVTIETGNAQVMVRPQNSFGKHARIYGAFDLVPGLMALEPFTDYCIPFRPETDEDKVRAGIWKAWKRETVKAVTPRLREIVAQLADEGVLDLPDGLDSVILQFSQKAGCSCGCSPGFIVKGGVRSGIQAPWSGWRSVDIWVEPVADAS